ncbi:SiaB family protein kinase [Paucibacter sp. PLA-PC-4]|uniref:SiaB family protein kinase n=1 Tax=Paucibacter sp. PLA-PC-4 TaxID=2993655 RepID=UPI002248F106|nr:SiaB family protein kinase [Paucibacter sp. PLA-PC-4]MCX2863193.1 SiaB family protein kinase [Paucibacter sp. PLA-PC-4]
MSSPAPIVQEYGAFFDLAQRHRVIFYYVGYFSQNIIAAMAEAVKLQLEISGVDGPTRRKLFSSFIEMAQNIIHYSADALTPGSQTDRELRHGSVCISERDGRYLLLCANPVEAGVAEGLREKLERLRSMTLDEIKKAYREGLRAETPEGSKGAGMGFLTMARDASEPLAFSIEPMDDRPDTQVLSLRAVI